MSSLQLEQQPGSRVKRVDKHSKQRVVAKQQSAKVKYIESKYWKRLRAIKKQRFSSENFVSDEIDSKWANWNEPGPPLGDGWAHETLPMFVKPKLMRCEPEDHYRNLGMDFSHMSAYWG